MLIFNVANNFFMKFDRNLEKKDKSYEKCIKNYPKSR